MINKALIAFNAVPKADICIQSNLLRLLPIDSEYASEYSLPTGRDRFRLNHWKGWMRIEAAVHNNVLGLMMQLWIWFWVIFKAYGANVLIVI